MAARDIDTIDDCIFLKTDPLFYLALQITSELDHANLLELQAAQEASIENILRSKIDSEKYSFGGVAASVGQRTRCFAETALSVLRMAMLQSAGVDLADDRKLKEYLPSVGLLSINNKKMSSEYGGPHHFVLAHDEATASKYYNCFDQLYPLSKIKDQLLMPEKGHGMVKVKPSGAVMLIFRNNFTQVIEFDVTFTVDSEKLFKAEDYIAKWDKRKFRQSFVHISCFMSKIKDNKHYSLNILRSLKKEDSRSRLLQTLEKHQDEWMPTPLHQELDQLTIQ